MGAPSLTYLKSPVLHSKPLRFYCDPVGMKSCWQYFNRLPRRLVAGINIRTLALDPKEGYDWVRLGQWPHFLSFPGKVQKRLKKMSVQKSYAKLPRDTRLDWGLSTACLRLGILRRFRTLFLAVCSGEMVIIELARHLNLWPWMPEVSKSMPIIAKQI